MKKIFILFAVILLGTAIKVQAQEYNWAIGIRGGVTATGLSVKHHFNPANAIEGIVDFVQGVNFYGLYERNIPVISRGFNFYYGGGVNIGGWDSEFTMGVNGIIGLEYKIQSIPLALSVDYKPNLNFCGHTGFHALDFGLGVKVTF